MGPNVLRGSLRLPYWEETEDRPGPKQGDRLGNSCRNQVRDGGGLGQGRINRRVGSCSTGDVFWKWSLTDWRWSGIGKTPPKTNASHALGFCI